MIKPYTCFTKKTRQYYVIFSEGNAVVRDILSKRKLLPEQQQLQVMHADQPSTSNASFKVCTIIVVIVIIINGLIFLLVNVSKYQTT